MGPMSIDPDSFGLVPSLLRRRPSDKSLLFVVGITHMCVVFSFLSCVRFCLISSKEEGLSISR